MTKLTENQIDFLKGLNQYRGGVDYSGTSQQLRARLTELGLVKHRGMEHSPDKHLRFSSYSLTELGMEVLCASQFDLGLKKGYRWYCEEIDRKMEALAEEREMETLRSFGTTPQALAGVRKALFANVERLTS